MASKTFLRTRVAGRILVFFFVGAMGPVAVLAILSYRAVTQQLIDQSEGRLEELAGSSQQLLVQRLQSTTAWAEDATGSVTEARASAAAERLPFRLTPAIEGVALQEGGSVTEVVGVFPGLPSLSEGEAASLRTRGRVLKTAITTEGPTVHLAVREGDAGDALWVRLRPDSIWAPVLMLGSDATFEDLCVFSAELQPFACVQGADSELPGRVPAAEDRQGISGIVRFELDGEPRISVWRAVYLRSSFGAPEWFVMASQTEASVLSPVSGFTYNLLLSLAVGLALVLLLANALVVRTMEPLAKLTEGTRSISKHDLSVQVDVSSDDEFGELAQSFNSMAGELSRQFRQLEASQAIDRAVIDENDVAAAVGAMLDGAGGLLQARKAAVLLFDIDSDGRAAVCHRAEGSQRVTMQPVEVTEAGLAWVPRREPAWLAHPRAAAEYLGLAGIGQGADGVYAAPMIVQRGLVGVAVFTCDPDVEFTPNDLDRARQLVDRGAVALNEVRLRRELAELSDEAMRALANAVDAKSRWTAGHSQRVTGLGMAIGEQLGLDDEEIEILHRGGLLHDIGKIGVPREVLDFPGRLDDDMRRAVEAHPTIGAGILEPVRVFRPLIPIVRHHHERWDGRGYPDGLAGSDIPHLARVLAVADVFDAMISARPYREGLARDIVVSHIREGMGSQFDPGMVVAFEAVMEAGWIHDEVLSMAGAHV